MVHLRSITPVGGFLSISGQLSMAGQLSIALAVTACNSGDGESSSNSRPGDGDGDEPSERPAFTETNGGTELPPHEEREGRVTIVGQSEAVPVSNRSFAGYRDPEADGTEVVRCNYYPDGSAEYPYPYVEVLAGIQGRLHYQAQAQMFRFVPGEAVEVPLGTEDSVEAGLQELIVFGSLTHETEEGAYRYWYGVDEFAYPPYGSTCSVEVMTLDEESLVGSVQCADLIATPDSPDAPVTNAPYPTAQVTIDFDCPVVRRDPAGGEYSDDPGGTCDGYATPCILLEAFECAVAPGCSPTGTCSGSARPCDDYFEFYSCESQDGCYWSGFECYGFPDGCFGYEDEVECILHDGCDWRDDCEGLEFPCSSYRSLDSCESQECSWEAR